jgi:hypothetical protein
MRSRLARALEPTSPDTAAMVRDEQRTKLTEVPAEWLTGWVMIDVLHYAANHPRRLYVALSDDDTATVLTGKPEGFNAVVAGGAEPTAGQAGEIARTFLDVTRDFTKWSYRVDSTDDIEWLPKLDADQAKSRDQLIKEFATKISAPRPVADDDGWAITLWTVTGTNLVQHDLVVRADRTVQATAVVVAEGMPVPDSA